MISNSQVTGGLPYQCEETTSDPALENPVRGSPGAEALKGRPAFLKTYHKHSLLPLDPQMPRVKSQHAPEDRCSL